MATYTTLGEYLLSNEALLDELGTIREIIRVLRASMLDAAATANIEEYQLNDGQTIIKTVYRDPKQIQGALEMLQRDEQKIINKGVGRVSKLRDSNSFFVNK